MNFNGSKKLFTVAALAVGLIGINSMTATPANAFWPPKCADGAKLVKQPHVNAFHCRERTGTKRLYKAGRCFLPTPNLLKHAHLGFTYACGVQVGTTQIWNKFVCKGKGLKNYRPAKKATAKNRTCVKTLPTYTRTKPTF